MTRPLFTGMEPERALKLIAEKRAADARDRLVETRAELWVRVYVHAVTTDNVHDPEAAGTRADTAVAVFDRRFLPAQPSPPPTAATVHQTTVEGE